MNKQKQGGGKHTHFCGILCIGREPPCLCARIGLGHGKRTSSSSSCRHGKKQNVIIINLARSDQAREDHSRFGLHLYGHRVNPSAAFGPCFFFFFFSLPSGLLTIARGSSFSASTYVWLAQVPQGISSRPSITAMEPAKAVTWTGPRRRRGCTKSKTTQSGGAKCAMLHPMSFSTLPPSPSLLHPLTAQCMVIAIGCHLLEAGTLG